MQARRKPHPTDSQCAIETAVPQAVTTPGHDDGAAATITVSRVVKETETAPALQRMAAVSGQSPIALVREFAGLAFGPGGITFNDYVKLRLFDNDFWAGADKRQVVGKRRHFEISAAVNWRQEQLALISDKIASAAYFSAYGLPTIPGLAVWAPNVSSDRSWVIDTREGLEAFLQRDDVYPLFGKPVGGIQSLGSIGFARRLSATELEKVTGEIVETQRFIDDVVTNYRDGYLFQNVQLPHPDIIALAGPRLGTARILTMVTEDGPRVMRATWKIPTVANVVDNYWRSGNMLARLDLDCGTVTRVVTGEGLDLSEVTRHPDTGAPMVGFRLPHWQRMKETALAGASLMRSLPLLGWDMASTADGPLIVEANPIPDLALNQLADARGVMDETFAAAIAFHKSEAKATKRRRK